MQFHKITPLALVVLGLQATNLAAQQTETPTSQGVYEALKAHPELLDEALSRTKKKAYGSKSKYQEKNDRAREHQADIYKEEGYPLIGNKGAPHTVVVFSDPQCGHCHGMLKDLMTYTKQHDDVKFVLKDIPFLGPLSDRLSEQALLAVRQGHFEGWLESFLTHTGPLDEAALKGLMVAGQIENVAMPADIRVGIDAAKALAKAVGIKSTPTFILEGRVYEDYRGLEPFSALIDRRLRKTGS
jgi:protein-disulfide isomerase